ncbi:MAG TPA: GAP family protein [Vicinamibacterales bacterium]
MGEAIGNILLLAVAVAVFPVPIIAVVLLLMTPRGVVNGVAFVVGWLVGLTAVGVVAIVLAPEASESDGAPAPWVSLVLLALGIAAVGLAVRQWRGRPRGDEKATAPAWMSAIQTFTPRKSLGTGVVLSGANPKNALLGLAAAAEIAQTGIPVGEQAVAYGVFVVIATVGVAVPVVVTVAKGDAAASMLERVETWMVRNSAVIMTILMLLIGAKLVGDAIVGLTA